MATLALGFMTTNRYSYRDEGAEGFTLKTVAKRYPRGTFYVHVRGHILALVDGEILDWTAGSSRKVLAVNEVSPA
jgi:hypothetical protein